MEIEVAMTILLIFWTLLGHGNVSGLMNSNSSHPLERSSHLAANIKELNTAICELKDKIDSLEQKTTSRYKCDYRKRRFDAKNSQIAALKNNIDFLKKIKSETERKNAHLQRTIAEIKASLQRCLGVKLLVLYNASRLSLILNRPEIQQTGKFSETPYHYVKCCIPRFDVGEVTFRTLRDVLQPLFKGDIQMIGQQRGITVNKIKVAMVTNKDTDLLTKDWDLREFCSENGEQWQKPDLKSDNWKSYHDKSRGKLLLSWYRRRTVLVINFVRISD